MIDKLKIINVKEIQNKAGNIIKFVSKKKMSILMVLVKYILTK